MGIEPTWRLCRRHAGFEARGGHQSRVHPQASRLWHQTCQLSVVSWQLGHGLSTADWLL